MGIAVAVIVVVLLAAYVIGIFVLDHKRRKKGKPSIFVDECEHKGKGKLWITRGNNSSETPLAEVDVTVK